jgi:hypothetical protein
MRRSFFPTPETIAKTCPGLRAASDYFAKSTDSHENFDENDRILQS